MRRCGLQHDAIQREQQGERLRKQVALVATRDVDALANDLGQKLIVKVRFIIQCAYKFQEQLEYDVQWNMKMLNAYYANSTGHSQLAPAMRSIQHRNWYQQLQGLMTDSGIRFELHSVVYVPTDTSIPSGLDTIRYFDSAIKAHGQVDTLNVWVADIGPSLLGYGVFPADLTLDGDKHGVVISVNTFKRDVMLEKYNRGATLAHEVGHSACGLLHTFQTTIQDNAVPLVDLNANEKLDAEEREGDMVADTAYQRDPTYGNPLREQSIPHSVVKHRRVPCCFTSIMDYCDDEAFLGLTRQQSKRARLILLTLRRAWLKL